MSHTGSSLYRSPQFRIPNMALTPVGRPGAPSMFHESAAASSPVNPFAISFLGALRVRPTYGSVVLPTATDGGWSIGGMRWGFPLGGTELRGRPWVKAWVTPRARNATASVPTTAAIPRYFRLAIPA